MVTGKAKYNRILLKLSGEALSGTADFGIDPKILDHMALEIGQLVGIGAVSYTHLTLPTTPYV